MSRCFAREPGQTDARRGLGLRMNTPFGRDRIEEILPHREPFLLLDEVVELEPGSHVVARKTVREDEWYLKGHFPGEPIVPGVILVDSCAQAATVMALSMPEQREGLGLFAGIEEMRFKRIVRPGDTGRFEAIMEKFRRSFARVKVRALVGDEVAAEGTILAIFQPRQK